MSDIAQQLIEQVKSAGNDNKALKLVGRNSKPFFGRAAEGEILDISGHTGIVSYNPAELVLTARAGTPLAEIESALNEHGQHLSFEPPSFGEQASIGGTLACNLSGPGRPWKGSVRDMVLGLRMINGQGEHLRFGGQVMKNVAGYDVSRLQAGALGCLGIVTEISLKVLPKPAATLTVTISVADAQKAITIMNELAGNPQPLSGACWLNGTLFIRFEGAESAVNEAGRQVCTQFALTDTNILESATQFWRDLREQRLTFFAGDQPLWRLSSGSTLPHSMPDGDWLIDWGGAQRWLRSSCRADELSEQISDQGQLSLFRYGDRDADVFPQPDATIRTLHQRLKASFDPDGIFNPGRLYSWL